MASSPDGSSSHPHALPTSISLTPHRYEGDEVAPKDPVPVPSQPTAPENTNTGPAPGYGQEPEFEHDPSSFEAEMTVPEPSGNGTNGDYSDQKEAELSSEPGIRMKDDG